MVLGDLVAAPAAPFTMAEHNTWIHSGCLWTMRQQAREQKANLLSGLKVERAYVLADVVEFNKAWLCLPPDFLRKQYVLGV